MLFGMSRLLAPARVMRRLLAATPQNKAALAANEKKFKDKFTSEGRAEQPKKGVSPSFRVESEPLVAQAAAAGPVKGDWFSGQAQQLRCELGDHVWARAAVRGRKPTACPEHR